MSIKAKAAVGIIGTILLGAIGSGVWELAFAPMASRIGRGILTVFTLGLESARDGIYQSVAKGHHELPSLYLYGFLAILVMFFPLFIVLPAFARARIRRALTSKVPTELESMRRRLQRRLFGVTAVGMLLGAAFFVRFVMHNYVNLAVTYFEQSMRIVGPYLEVYQERQLRSDFASIKNKRDYTELMSKIREVAKRHGKELPQFTVW